MLSGWKQYDKTIDKNFFCFEDPQNCILYRALDSAEKPNIEKMKRKLNISIPLTWVKHNTTRNKSANLAISLLFLDRTHKKIKILNFDNVKIVMFAI